MKFKHYTLSLSLCMLLIPFGLMAGDNVTFADSLLRNASFVIRGEMSKRWNRMVKFAVSDPVKNHGHEIHAEKDGWFEMVAPMHGVMQDMYLYVDGTVTIPVCAGDTINLTLGEDDMRLSASKPGADLDLQLAQVMHRKMRRQYMDINMLFNEYYRETDGRTSVSLRADSLLSELSVKIYEYQQRNKVVMDTFIAHNGVPRNEEYFRIRGHFETMFFISMQDGLQHITAPGYISEANPSVGYSDYHERWLMYPAYRRYVLSFLDGAVEKALHAFKRERSDNEFLHSCALSRSIAPSSLLADIANMSKLHAMMRFSGAEKAKKYIGQVYDTSHAPAVREMVATFIPDIERVLPGRQAPQLVMKDADGNIFTIDDFKGQYVYLDFWDFGCSPCIREFGVIPQLKEHYAGRLDNMVFVTVCGSTPSRGKFESFVKKHLMNDRNLIFDRKQSDSVYDNGVFPTYILIDPEGCIVEFNTMRPSDILREAASGNTPIFEKALVPKSIDR